MILLRCISHLRTRLVQNITHRTCSYHKLIDVHPEVKRSLQQGSPVVSLESTIITHGMPHPQNLETAIEVEELVRKNGAIPATIAIIDGRIKVGLTEGDLVKLACKQQHEVIKCSRRDLPFAVANKQSGGTTVAATMLISHLVGLKIFATGGVGGVHREGHISMDISADLVELGRTPVAVVCGGVKSILDIPRTLEYLETQGVCVATYRSDGGRFPDFYTRDSGCKVPYNLQNPSDAAELIKSLDYLDLKSGILIGVPIPAEYAADKEIIDAAIEQAYIVARAQGIQGKQVTPFLLAAIAKITKGHSLQANIALIKNNATVAAQIAHEFYRPKSYGLISQTTNAPLIVGASILDLSLTMLDDMPTQLDGATYQTHAKQSAGGVGRNLAEGIFKLHGAAKFLSVVGDDQMGQSLLRLIPEPLQAGVQVNTDCATSLCSVIFDKMGDCKLILGSMEIHERITPQRILECEEHVRTAPLIVMDGNLSLPSMECLLQLAQKHQRPVFFEPTDMRIAGKPFALGRSVTQQIKIISPNLHELRTLVDIITRQTTATQQQTKTHWEEAHQVTEKLLEKTKILLMQIQEYFDCILVTLGHHGVLLSVRTKDAFFDPKTGDYLLKAGDQKQKHLMQFYHAPIVPNITNVSGAGDSFSSGFITGLLRGYEVERCIAFGFIAAERALQSSSAVPTNYFSSKNDEFQRLEQYFEQIAKACIYEKKVI